MSNRGPCWIAIGMALTVAACDRSATKPTDKNPSKPAPAAGAGAAMNHGDHPMPPAPAADAAPPTMKVTPTAPIVPGQPAPLTLELLAADGTRIREVEMVHEKLLHFIVVASDLSYFSHEHPERQPDGTFTHPLAPLPHPGAYVVYGDFTPTGGKQVVARTALTVAGAAPPAIALAPVGLPAHATFGDFDVTLAADRAPAAGAATMLSFAISSHGTPVTDLRNYLGARGHCVVISADTTKFVHSHPLAAATGAEVQFHTVFPAPGTYKLWAEFRPAGKTLIASFVVEVGAGATGTGTGHDMPMPMDMPMPKDDGDHGH